MDFRKKLNAVIAASVMVLALLATTSAQAGCRDYPESVTDACISQNLAEEQARQAEYQQRAAQELLDAQRRAEQAQQEQFVANGSRSCSLPENASSPSCVIENLAYEQQRQAQEKARLEQIHIDAKKAEEENTYKNWMADGGRACAVAPASLTPECIAENLVFEQKRQETYAEKMAKSILDAQALAEYQQKRQFEATGGRICSLYPEAATAGCIAETKAYNENLIKELGLEAANKIITEQKAVIAQAKIDYIQGGRRECTTYPASLKPECIEENTAYAEETAAQIAFLEAKKAVDEKAKVIAVRDEEGDLLVDMTVPKKVDLLIASVRLVDKKKMLIDTAEVRYDAEDDPYFVFDDAEKAGTYKIEFKVGKKITAGSSVKVPKVG
jgi:hypothetical protein